MATKDEFVEMWKKEEEKLGLEGSVDKKYFVYFGHNAIKCTSYQFSPSGEYVGLLYGNEKIAMIEIGIIEMVGRSKKGD